MPGPGPSPRDVHAGLILPIRDAAALGSPKGIGTVLYGVDFVAN